MFEREFSMYNFVKYVVKRMICYLMAMVVLVAGIIIPAENVATEEKKKSVYDEIQKASISYDELMTISESALTDGKNTADIINAYTENVDYETAVNYALTAYYENDEYTELDEFVNTIDERAFDIVEGYKIAAEERNVGDVNGYEVGKVLITFNKDTTINEIEAIVEAEMGKCEEVTELFNGQYMATISISLGQTVEMAKDEYSKYSITDITASNDLAAITDYASNYVNDLSAVNQYYLDTINALDAWNYVSQHAHKKVLVGVIDTGIDLDHPDLDEVISPLSADITGSTPVLLKNASSQYTKAHGTNVAGVIAAEANNNTGVAGVASCYNNDVVEILAVQASTYYSSYADYRFSLENAIKAMNYCVEKGAKVINYSVGGLGLNTLYEDIINQVTAAGVIFVCSAGNDATDAAYGPADVDEAISAVSTTSYNTLSSFTNYGMKKDICAPGSSIYTTNAGGGMTYINGTSFSSPIIASVVAMMCSVNNNLDYLDARRILAETSVDLGFGQNSRNGLVNAGAAVKMAAKYNTDWKMENLAQNKSVTASSTYDTNGFPVANLVDGKDNTKWISNNSNGQSLIIDLGELYMVNDIDVIYDRYIVSGLQALVSEDGKSWKKVTDDSIATLYTSDIEVGMVKAKYIMLYYTGNTSYVIINEIKVWGYQLSDSVEYATEAPTTEAPTTEAPTTTTTIPSTAPLEVIAPIVSCTADNTLGVVWGQDNERILSGCLYNVYIDGVKYLSLVQCNYYTLTGVKAGTVTVKVTSVTNGVESTGVCLSVYVTGNITEQTTTEQTTTEQETTIENEEYAVVYENIATGKTTYSSSNENADYSATKATDGTMGTRWSSGWTDNEWITVDLGVEYTVGVIGVFWEAAYAKEYKVQVSVDGTTWKDVKTVTNSYCTNNEFEITPVTAKYVRIQGVKRATTYGYSIYEIQIYAVDRVNHDELLSKGKKVVSSSNETNDFSATNAVDGNNDTRWSSGWTDNEWIYVDLGESKYVSYVEFNWEAAYAKAYNVLVSNDGINWTLVKSITSGKGGIEKVDIFQNARYVKMQGVARSTVYGYSLYEMSVY